MGSFSSLSTYFLQRLHLFVPHIEHVFVFCFAFIYAFNKLNVRRVCGYASHLELAETLENKRKDLETWK
jgi:hypothetical protein